MDSEQLKKLRQFYSSLLEQQRFLSTLSGGASIEKIAIRPLLRELKQLNSEFPDLILPLQINERVTRYNFISVMTYLGSAIGRLRIAIEEPTGNPITEKRHFKFISNPDLRTIIERDYDELQRAYISGCWKSVIILCGGAIEAILTDLLVQNETAAKAAKSAPQNSEIIRWDLSNLIDVAVELSLVSDGINKLSHSLREYRNLVHPGNELRTKLRFDAEEARIALEVLNILHRDLSS
jgi:hypothetical protein